MRHDDRRTEGGGGVVSDGEMKVGRRFKVLHGPQREVSLGNCFFRSFSCNNIQTDIYSVKLSMLGFWNVLTGRKSLCIVLSHELKVQIVLFEQVGDR